MLIDKVGYDEKVMAAITEAEFVKIHKDNDAIGRGLAEDARVSYLKGVHAKLKEKVAKDAKDAADAAAAEAEKSKSEKKS